MAQWKMYYAGTQVATIPDLEGVKVIQEAVEEATTSGQQWLVFNDTSAFDGETGEELVVKLRMDVPAPIAFVADITAVR